MRGRLVALVVVVAVVAYVLVQVLRPAPAVAAHPVAAVHTVSGPSASLSWPATGEAALGVEGTGLVMSHQSSAETPLASLAKIMTAYVVLHDHPLAAGATGPAIAVTAADVTLYQQDVAVGDSAVPVQTGESLSELDALEALLIPSGDNVAIMLADWDAGSETAFVAKMNAAARSLGLTHTHYADASGLDPASKGTAADQVRLALAAMELPVFRQIVSMPQVTLPVAGVQYNVDALLGTDGIVGVKTGWTTTAGGCFVFAADSTVRGQPVTLVGAVLDQTTSASESNALLAAFNASTTLIASAHQALVPEVVPAGTTLGTLEAPWASPVALRATRAISLYGLAGMAMRTQLTFPSTPAAPVSKGQDVGTAEVTLGGQRASVPLAAATALPAVSIGWRLTHF